MAAMIRGFFKAFSSGIIDSRVADPAERQQPRTVKQTMLEHYEHIAGHFHQILFYSIAGINYTYDEIARRVQAAGKADGAQLMRVACRTDEGYRLMVSEYKRNFTALLEGRNIPAEAHIQSYCRCAALGLTDSDTAIRLVTRTVVKAYLAGRKQGGGSDSDRCRGALMRLTLDAMAVLLDGEQPAGATQPGNSAGRQATSALPPLAVKVCHGQHNAEIALGEMEALCHTVISPEP